MRCIKQILFITAFLGLAFAGPQSASYQLQAYSFAAGPVTTLNSTNYQIPLAAIPGETVGDLVGASYSGFAGVVPQYTDITPPSISVLAVVSGLTVYNVADDLQISFTVSKALKTNPTVQIMGRVATYVSKTGLTYTYHTAAVYGDSGQPTVIVSGVDIDSNPLNYSSAVTTVTFDTALKAPTGLTSYYDTPNHTYRLSWDNMPNENGYVVEVKLGTYPWTIFNTLAKDSTAYADVSFMEGVQTQYRMKAIYDQGAGNIDESLYATILAPIFVPLAAPQVAVGAYDSQAKQISISWSMGSPSTHEYLIQRAVNGGGYTDVITLPAAQTTYTDTTVQYGKTYEYKIIARNTYGGASQPQEYSPVNAGRVPIPAGADYYYDVVGSATDATNSGVIRLHRQFDDGAQSTMYIDAAALGINLMTASLNAIEITKNTESNLMQIFVPTETALAVAVSNDITTTKKVPVTFTGLALNKTPVIFLNGQAITDGQLQVKPAFTDYVMNIVWNSTSGILSFDILHFTTYTIGSVDSVLFVQQMVVKSAGTTVNIQVSVRDSLNQPLENAPVTFSITSGASRFAAGAVQAAVTTNPLGIASVELTMGQALNDITLISAQADGVTSNPDCEVVVAEGVVDTDGDGMPDLWETRYGLNPNSASDALQDVDSDGVTNFREYLRGTNPTVTDTDHDGVDDWHDAYPLQPGLKVFNAAFTQSYTGAAAFTGIAPNTHINAYANNVRLRYDGLQNFKTGQDDGLTSITDPVVAKISGVALPRIYDGGLGEQYTGSMYTALMPGQNYAVRYQFVNRGNGTDTYQVQSSLEQTDVHWNINAPASLTVAPWQLGSFDVVIAANTSINALEQVTVNVGVALSFDTAQQYQAYANAYLGGTYQNAGIYGGVQSIASQAFILQAEGYDVTVINRVTEMTLPAGVPTSNSAPIPGALLTYKIVLQNRGTMVAHDVVLMDRIPEYCHLYYTTPPTIQGSATGAWEGATDNTATRNTTNAVRYRLLTIQPQAIVTLSYTVSVD